jgi:putative transposase
MDFLHDALATGRKLRTLSIEDAYTREMLAIEVDTSLPALRVVRVLERLKLERGLPERIVIDHGTEFTSKALDQWTTSIKLRCTSLLRAARWRTAISKAFMASFARSV